MEVPLAVRLPVTRRVGQLGSKFELPPERSALNILLVTARPFGRGDVGYRTMSRPLLDGLRQSSLPVTLDLVRPGTWEALRGHLRAAGRAARDGLVSGRPFRPARRVQRVRRAGTGPGAGPVLVRRARGAAV